MRHGVIEYGRAVNEGGAVTVYVTSPGPTLSGLRL